MPSGKRCFCLSRGSELSSLPRLRILGTFANGFSSRLLTSVSRTWKCQVIRTETGMVLAADDQARHRHSSPVVARRNARFTLLVRRLSSNGENERNFVYFRSCWLDDLNEDTR